MRWIVFLLFSSLLCATEIEYEKPLPNVPIVNECIVTHPLFPKVNPISGEYIEEVCD